MTPKVTFALTMMLWTVIIAFFLTSCSALTDLAVGAVTNQVADNKPLVGVDTEIVAGDKQQGVLSGTDTKLDDVELGDNSQIVTHTTGRRTDVSGTAEQVTLNEGVPYWQAILAVLVTLFITLLIGMFMPQFQLRRK